MSVPPGVRRGSSGLNEPEHRSCSEHMSIKIRSRRSRRWKILSGELDKSKNTTKMDCLDL